MKKHSYTQRWSSPCILLMVCPVVSRVYQTWILVVSAIIDIVTSGSLGAALE